MGFVKSRVFRGSNLKFNKIPKFTLIYKIIMVELTGEGRACIPVGLTKT